MKRTSNFEGRLEVLGRNMESLQQGLCLHFIQTEEQSLTSVSPEYDSTWQSCSLEK